MDLTDHIRRIEQRLDKIEYVLKISAQPSTAPQPDAKTATARKPGAKTFEAEVTKSGNWLGLVATICFILAAVFIIKLSIDTGWLTPDRQIGLAYVFGLSLIGIGLLLKRIDRVYASFLPATGIVILYLATFAAYQLYLLIPFGTALALTSAISIACILLYFRFKHDIYAIIAAAGAYLSPLLLLSLGNQIFVLYYFIICSITFALISVWVQSRTLTVIAAYLAVLVNSIIGVNYVLYRLVAFLLPIHFLIFAVGTVIYTRLTRKKLTELESWSFLPVLFLFYSMEYYFINQIQPGWAPWISLGFAAFLFGLYLSAARWMPEQSLESQPMILAFTTLVFVHSFYLELLTDYLRVWFLVIILLSLAALPNAVYQKSTMKKYIVPLFGLSIIVLLTYCSLLFRLLTEPYVYYWTIGAIAVLVSIWYLFIQKAQLVKPYEEAGYLLLTSAHVLAITALYQFTQRYNFGPDVASLTLSISWLIYAIAVMCFGFLRRDKIMTNSALIVLSFAAAKVLLYDVANAPTIVRIVCLILTGAVLYGSGFLFKKIASWK